MEDWSDYRLALALFEAGSHAAAGRLLGLSQPTVSRRLRLLEERLGGALFARRGEALAPTPLGASVLDHVRRMREEAAAIARAARAESDRIEGDVAVAASEGVGADWLPRALSPLLQRHRGLTVSIKLGFDPANLAAGEADIALRWLRPGTQHSLLARKAAAVGAGIYAASAYLDQAGRPESARDLAAHSEVSWDSQLAFAWPTDKGGERVRPARKALCVASPTAHAAALEAGLGLGVTTHRLVRLRPGLERVLPAYELELDLWLVAHDGARRSRVQALVLDHLGEALRRDRAHFRSGAPSIFAEAVTEAAG